jgi:hypothetical protein
MFDFADINNDEQLSLEEFKKFGEFFIASVKNINFAQKDKA